MHKPTQTEINEIIKNHAEWLKDPKKGKQAVFSNMDLTGANISRAKLSGAYLTHAKLTYAKLSYANLTGANLTNANLENAYLTGAKLTDANLTGANLTNANLENAYLTGANFENAKFNRTWAYQTKSGRWVAITSSADDQPNITIDSLDGLKSHIEVNFEDYLRLVR